MSILLLGVMKLGRFTHGDQEIMENWVLDITKTLQSRRFWNASKRQEKLA